MSKAQDEACRMDIENWFIYHPVVGNQAERYVALREAAKVFANTIVDLVPSSADRTVAIRKLRECVMTANAAIACEERGEATTR